LLCAVRDESSAILFQKGDDVTYALFGAAGTVGQAVAAELAVRKLPFRAVGRTAATLENRFAEYGSLAERVAADLSDPQDARRAARGVETVIYAVGVPYDQFAKHPVLTRIALEAVSAQGVRRFVLVSSVYSYGLPRVDLIDETQPREPQTFKGRMRKEQEDLVLAAHAPGVFETAVVRTADFYGPTAELSLAWQIFSAAVAGKRANVLAPIDTPHEFVYVPDLGRMLVELSQTGAAFGSAWNFAGPQRITVREFARRIYAAAGSQPKLFAVNRTMLRIFGLFDPTMRELVEMNYLQSAPVNLDDSRLRSLFPSFAKTSYDEGIAQTLSVVQPQGKSAA